MGRFVMGSFEFGSFRNGAFSMCIFPTAWAPQSTLGRVAVNDPSAVNPTFPKCFVSDQFLICAIMEALKVLNSHQVY